MYSSFDFNCIILLCSSCFAKVSSRPCEWLERNSACWAIQSPSMFAPAWPSVQF
jgi:hypothetical protein